MARENLGTIPSDALFGFSSPGARDRPSAAATGLRKPDISPALWFCALIGVLVLFRYVWESAS
jgi:hypothetical protein